MIGMTTLSKVVVPDAKMYKSLKETTDETLFLELVLRGYDLSSVLRDNGEKPTAEIVKIG